MLNQSISLATTPEFHYAKCHYDKRYNKLRQMPSTKLGLRNLSENRVNSLQTIGSFPSLAQTPFKNSMGGATMNFA